MKENNWIDEQRITHTLETNYMPYAMSVIVSRAIPEIDGFKPSHRKLLYTMYKMNLLSGSRTKSANIVGQTMKLNPHGDMAIYETMVRLAEGHEALLHAYVDSKGNFGKHYSRDMAFAASRYTEAKLAPICHELFCDIDRDTVDMVDNYDNTLKEPVLFPTTFPNVLVNANQGIAVGMASNICSFNLKEVCETTIAFIKDPDHNIMTTLLAPDFSTGGELLYDQKEMQQILETGRGGFKVRAKYRYDKQSNCLEILEIPYTTSVEVIIDKIVELVKGGKVREISDIRDETDLNGLKITLDLKRGTDPDKLMQKLFKLTPLQDTFSCNFNILIGGTPRVMGVREILDEWTAFRIECIKRGLFYELKGREDRLHLLTGLNKILLDIDKAVSTIRETEEEDEVIPNLMIAFGIDEKQAEFIADIKLRNLNRQYILKVLADTQAIRDRIDEIKKILDSRKLQEKLIIDQLTEIKKKYGAPRRTDIIYDKPEEYEAEAEQAEDYAVHLFLTREGYFKKVTPQSLRMSGDHKLKDGDEVAVHLESTNRADLLFFTNKCQVYKAKAYEFEDGKISNLGDFIPVKLGFEQDELPVAMVATTDYKGFVLFAFDNGRIAKVPLDAYETKTNRKKLANAFCDKFPLVGVIDCTGEQDVTLTATNGRILTVNTAQIPLKTTRNTQGVIVMTLRAKHTVVSAALSTQCGIPGPEAYRTAKLPAIGSARKDKTGPEQLKLGE